MPVSVTTFFLPANAGVPFILEDLHLRGGFKVYNTVAERDASHPFSRKPGMLCYTADEDTYFKLQPDRITWEEFKLGGEDGGLDASAIKEPLYITEDNKLAIRAEALLPKITSAGQVLTTTNQNTVEWKDQQVSIGQRDTKSFESPASVLSGETIEFELDLSKSVLLVTTTLSSPGLLLEGFSTNMRNDPNPYTFQSTVDYLSDEGIKVEGEDEVFVRRYSFMVNEEEPSKSTHYFRLTNKGELPVTPKVDITYVTLE